MPGQAADPPAFVRLAGHPLRWQLLTALADGDHRVRELMSLVGQPQSLVSYHLRLLRDGGLVTATRSSFDGRDSYYHLDLDRCADAVAAAGAALHPALKPDATAPPGGRQRIAVLFVCTGNSVRSPIAEALLRQHTGGRVHASSAGIHPKPEWHPNTATVLREMFDLTISDRRTRSVGTVARHRFHYVITLCDKAREACPVFHHDPRRVHWSIPDPAVGPDTDHSRFHRTATEIDARVRRLVPALTAAIRDFRRSPS